MIKRIVIAGCRDYTNYDEAKEYIDFCLSNIRKENKIIIISGGAKGADALGERYAKENGFFQKNTLLIGIGTVKVQGRNETSKWQKPVIM